MAIIFIFAKVVKDGATTCLHLYHSRRKLQEVSPVNHAPVAAVTSESLYGAVILLGSSASFLLFYVVRLAYLFHTDEFWDDAGQFITWHLILYMAAASVLITASRLLQFANVVGAINSRWGTTNLKRCLPHLLFLLAVTNLVLFSNNKMVLIICLNLFTILACGFLMAWAGERVQRFLANSALSGSYFGLRTVLIAEKIIRFKSDIKVNTSAVVVLAALIYVLDRSTPSSVWWGSTINVSNVLHALTATKLYNVMFSFLEPLRQTTHDEVSLYMYQQPPPLKERLLWSMLKCRVRPPFVQRSPPEVQGFSSFIPVPSGQAHRSCPSLEGTNEALGKIEEKGESKLTVMESSQRHTSNRELSGPPVDLGQSEAPRHKERRRGRLPAAAAPISYLSDAPSLPKAVELQSQISTRTAIQSSPTQND
eukprot:CAMPEP_0206395018 /NCGR_PEP_ID=MMETSP0294-20121207/21780_1 /ASSEMBLY_ACC=CAM_ASM_000327 /TAXON_ID=39354 /ORGANISM="Heterosigma akashiwo, Strain CCMP2393" /LENGTH=422 /DNA_ID=CAMNT_0053849159 /DNA_START=126 /DNA_END=1394 /DNA_ORIENTATION=+